MEKIIEREDGTKKVVMEFDPKRKIVRKKRTKGIWVKYHSYPERSRTKQEFWKQTDINTIMAKYDKTGQVDPLVLRDMQFGDFSDGRSFAEMAMKVKDAHFEFQQLPSQLREHYDNDPAKLLDALNKPEERENLLKWGVIEPNEQDLARWAEQAEKQRAEADKQAEASKQAPVEEPIKEEAKS